MRLAHAKFLFLLLIFFHPVFAFSANFATGIEAAEAAYRESKFPEALSLYEKEFTNAPNAVALSGLYFNAGNAAFRSAKLGLALAYFQRADALNRGDSDIAYNLALVEKSLATNTLRAKPYSIFPLSWDKALNTGTGTLLIIALLGFALFLATRIFAALPSFLAPTGFSLAIFGAALFAATYHFQSIKDAVVIADKSVIRSGPAETFPEISTIAEGSIVGIETEQSGWLKIYFQFAQAEGKRVVGWADPKTVLRLDK